MSTVLLSQGWPWIGASDWTLTRSAARLAELGPGQTRPPSPPLKPRLSRLDHPFAGLLGQVGSVERLPRPDTPSLRPVIMSGAKLQ